MPIHFDQKKAFNAVVLQSAAQQAQQARKPVMTSSSGGMFVPDRAQQASSFQPFTLAGDIQKRYNALLKGKR